MRLGTLQGWILVHAYLKAVKGALPEGWKMPNTWGRDYESVEWGRRYRQHYQDRLLKSEVLLNYYRLESSDIESRIIGQAKFKYNRAYRNALTGLGKALRRLKEKGLINVSLWYYEFEPTTILLTEEGRAVAERLLKAPDSGRAGNEGSGER
jgi:hypothetical protein